MTDEDTKTENKGGQNEVRNRKAERENNKIKNWRKPGFETVVKVWLLNVLTKQCICSLITKQEQEKKKKHITNLNRVLRLLSRRSS